MMEFEQEPDECAHEDRGTTCGSEREFCLNCGLILAESVVSVNEFGDRIIDLDK